jgi:hypothetical protein
MDGESGEGEYTEREGEGEEMMSSVGAEGWIVVAMIENMNLII